MNLSWKIFTAFKIPVRLHFTMIIIPFLAFSWVNTTGMEALVLATALTVLLFGSVLLHEFGHALTGRRYGVYTEDIVLTPIGGMARMRSIPEGPREEIAISIAGPMVSFAIAGAAFGLGIGFQLMPVYYPLVVELLQVLFRLNLMLGLFNLVPALPMDGGRVLRGVLALKFSHLKATQIASRIGKALAIAGGLYGLMNSQWTLVFIAIFIYSAANQEMRVALMRDAYRRAKQEGTPTGWSPFGSSPSGGSPFRSDSPFHQEGAPFGGRGYYVYRETGRGVSDAGTDDDWKDGASDRNAKVVDDVKVEVLSRKDPD
jgi:Zn-dependent protease